MPSMIPPNGAGHRAYLDHAATTPMRPEAIEAMLPYLTGHFGNPSGSHHESRGARMAVDDARDQIAALLGADLGEVVFTAGGTEADNLAVTGTWEAMAATPDPPGALVCTAMEHHAVLNTCRALARRTGAELREVRTGKDGIIDLDPRRGLHRRGGPGVGDGGEQRDRDGAAHRGGGIGGPLGSPRARAAHRRRPGRPVARRRPGHRRRPTWWRSAPTSSAGPRGWAPWWSAHGTRLRPVIHGGGQERERRSGTHNVAGIVAMAAALSATGVRAAGDSRAGYRPAGPVG